MQNYFYKVTQSIGIESVLIDACKIPADLIEEQKDYYDCFHLVEDHGRYACGFKNGKETLPDVYADFFYSSVDAYYWASAAMEDWENQGLKVVNFVSLPMN